MKLKNETEHQYWHRITKGEPGFSLYFKRCYSGDQEKRDHQHWNAVYEVLKQPWVKILEVSEKVKMYYVEAPPPKAQK